MERRWILKSPLVSLRSIKSINALLQPNLQKPPFPTSAGAIDDCGSIRRKTPTSSPPNLLGSKVQYP
ncbi:uncharacterized protein PgNI_03541 [Pyricularia grisea]|uniref:Uncharacterized protein n=1 Tax=Pyricularia grisea TaxID=148305 RepID=A0A6P8B865_PYRGI|nr:uncharacterized protein PgNI_03541 [Pyricularia grisea]TLD12008.1 hypothetical protein PgNI_03541 [Pyricularia grisea]